MKHLMTTLILLAAVISPVWAQEGDREAKQVDEAERVLEAESSVITNHEVTVKGQRFPYTAEAGTQPVWDEDGKPVASLFYIYYERTDVEDRAPGLWSFPSTAARARLPSGCTSPTPDRGFCRSMTKATPYNLMAYGKIPHSILDVADIVFVNPVNTGYSRILDKKADRKQFFGVNADIKYLAEWLNTFVTRKNRWPSPKYLIGESYGTTRVSGLSLAASGRAVDVLERRHSGIAHRSRYRAGRTGRRRQPIALFRRRRLVPESARTGATAERSR